MRISYNKNMSNDDDDRPRGPSTRDIEDLIDDIGGGRCFIATAAYSSPIAPKVMFLRRVRDNELKKTRVGSLFIQAYEWIYYKFSPRVASVMDQNPTFKTFMRIMIVKPIVKFLQVIFKSLLRIKHINIEP